MEEGCTKINFFIYNLLCLCTKRWENSNGLIFMKHTNQPIAEWALPHGPSAMSSMGEMISRSLGWLLESGVLWLVRGGSSFVEVLEERHCVVDFCIWWLFFSFFGRWARRYILYMPQEPRQKCFTWLSPKSPSSARRCDCVPKGLSLGTRRFFLTSWTSWLDFNLGRKLVYI